MKREISSVKQPGRIDYSLLLILFTLFITSITAINASGPYLQDHLSLSKLLTNQILWYILGAIAIFVLFYFNNETVYSFIKIIYWILIVLLALLLVDKLIVSAMFGTHLPFISDINGAWAWYQFPGIGSLQPSEFLKIVLILICAKEISIHNANKTENTFKSDIALIKKILKWCLLPVILILLQPDTGIVLIIGISIAMMLIVSGIRKEWILYGIIFSLIVIGIFFILFFIFPNVLYELFGGSYKLSRFYGWIYPEEYIEYGRQLYTALLNMGTAGLFGVGSEVGTTILEAQTDFIFAVFSRTYGFIGGLWIICLSLALDYRLYKIFIICKEKQDKYIIAGVLGILVYQQIQNIGMIIGLLPITGITLPFISYGGSSILSYMIMMGVIMNISRNAKKLSDFVY